jgi:hypothetical protein
MEKRGRKPKLSVARAKHALEQSGAIRSIAAHMLGVHRSTLYTFMVRHPSLETFAQEIEEELKDLAEAEIIKAIRAGDMQTVRWYAETKMKDRGYPRRTEMVGKDGGPVEVNAKLDLSKLSDEELETMIRLTEKAKGAPLRRAYGSHYPGNPACDCGTCTHPASRRTKAAA